MKSFLFPILIAVVLIAVGGYAFFKAIPDNAPAPMGDATATTTPVAEVEEPDDAPAAVIPEKPSPAPTPAPTPAPAPSGITKAEVALHADAASCWTIVNGEVYDLTSWISKHPGGKSAILRMCGTDGTASFEDQHGGDAKPEKILASYRIGTLAN